MQIQVHTDNQSAGGGQLVAHVERSVADSLGRFGEQITRVEVHLKDENSAKKAGQHDKRCVVEVRLAGRQPAAVEHHAATPELAAEGAIEKMKRLITHTLGRLESR